MKLLTRLREKYWNKQVSIAPLVIFRIIWGSLMLASIGRFWLNGWIRAQYIDPTFYFPFIDGLKPLGGSGMYVVFGIMILAAIGILFGFYYRIATILFFISFTYVELLDKTNYLNHYYFVSLVSFLIVFIPCNGDFSLDVYFGRTKRADRVPRAYQTVLRIQLGLVYFFAGLAKVNADWLLRAQPLKLWLASRGHLPVIGKLVTYKVTPYIFSWFGMAYDLTIPFLLSIRRILPLAYFLVIVFHLVTWFLFPIGMFPFIMIGATLIFFPAEFHERILLRLKALFRHNPGSSTAIQRTGIFQMGVFSFFLVVQLLVPLRFAFYKGNLFWNEEGFRFSWRVMLMEKAGAISFTVTDGDRTVVVNNLDYLTPQQEKMMATQPDMIVQFAEFLKSEFESKGFDKPEIYAQSRVTMNGRPGRTFVDPSVDLTSKVTKTPRINWIVQYD